MQSVGSGSLSCDPDDLPSNHATATRSLVSLGTNNNAAANRINQPASSDDVMSRGGGPTYVQLPQGSLRGPSGEPQRVMLVMRQNGLSVIPFSGGEAGHGELVGSISRGTGPQMAIQSQQRQQGYLVMLPQPPTEEGAGNQPRQASQQQAAWLSAIQDAQGRAFSPVNGKPGSRILTIGNALRRLSILIVFLYYLIDIGAASSFYWMVPQDIMPDYNKCGFLGNLTTQLLEFMIFEHCFK